ncbi:MAG: alpha-L-fucosidase, partial [Clostridia bacterium]|nr:alpha-L-fucosidase [Clostridia bacterium]
ALLLQSRLALPLGYNPNSSHQWKAINKDAPDLDRYREFVKNQVTELLTNYGPIYSFFWDIPARIEDPSMNQLIRKLQPGIYINDRGWDKGDFSTPEREYQATEGSRFTRMTEANNSVGQQSWGYREREDFYSIRHLIHAIDRYMSMGASYLLNAGPDANGVITEEYAKRFRVIGDWYNRMQGCLVCHEADEFDYQSRHNKCIATKKNGKTYLHFYEGIMSGAVNLKNYPGLPKKVRLMNTGAELNAEICTLPEFFNSNGFAEVKFLHIPGIPVDDLQNEAIVLEIEW